MHASRKQSESFDQFIQRIQEAEKQAGLIEAGPTEATPSEATLTDPAAAEVLPADPAPPEAMPTEAIAPEEAAAGPAPNEATPTEATEEMDTQGPSEFPVPESSGEVPLPLAAAHASDLAQESPNTARPAIADALPNVAPPELPPCCAEEEASPVPEAPAASEEKVQTKPPSPSPSSSETPHKDTLRNYDRLAILRRR